MPWRLTPKAEADLVEIGDRIAADNPRAARRLLAQIEKACALLGEGPLLGRARPAPRRPMPPSPPWARAPRAC
jgi:plasmid stabilization system protein ParE